MIGKAWSRYHYTLLGRGASDRLGLGALVTFFSVKVLRGRARVVLYVTAVLVLLLLVSKAMALDRWYWPVDRALTSGPAASGEEGVPRARRIVVFGENDVATPPRAAAGAQNTKSPSWTERLCEQLKCTSHLSFVPDGPHPGRPLASNQLYSDALDDVRNQTEHSTGPGGNYSFLPTRYPVPWDSPDLASQVSAFLAMDVPEDAPAETLWVFSLGTWDAWTLASLPTPVAMRAVDAMVDRMFVEIERLYASLYNPTAVARSKVRDAAAPTTEPVGESHAAAGQGRGTDEARAPGRTAGSREGETVVPAHFQILIPKLFDVTLTPGWKLERPELPGVHSKAEQLRNAVEITDHWNRKAWNAMRWWVQDGETAASAASAGTAFVKSSSHAPRPKQDAGQQAHTTTIPSILRREQHQAADSSDDDTAAAPVSAPHPQPHPQRDAIWYDMPAYLLEVMVESQFQRSHMVDSLGVGTRPANTTFSEVAWPCVVGAEAHDASDDEKAASGSSPTQRDGTLASAQSAEPPHESRGAAADTQEGRATVITDEPRGANNSTVDRTGVCDDPWNYLFYTPFALSQRAVEEIGRRAAHMVARNESVRAEWAGINKPAAPHRS